MSNDVCEACSRPVDSTGNDGCDCESDLECAINQLADARAQIERLLSILPPTERGQGFVGEGSWSVFAMKVVEERDELRAKLQSALAEIEILRAGRDG